jgi:dihydrofolate reductase
LITSIIVAKASNNAIGINGDLPWHLPADLKHFKKSTAGHHVIMGRKTFESLKKPLPGRTHIVVTTNRQYKVPDGHLVVNSIEEALKIGNNKGLDKIFILGGAEIYKLALPFTQEMIITEIETEPEADTFFPEFENRNWEITESEHHKMDKENPYNYAFVIYRKKEHS